MAYHEDASITVGVGRWCRTTACTVLASTKPAAAIRGIQPAGKMHSIGTNTSCVGTARPDPTSNSTADANAYMPTNVAIVSIDGADACGSIASSSAAATTNANAKARSVPRSRDGPRDCRRSSRSRTSRISPRSMSDTPGISAVPGPILTPASASWERVQDREVHPFERGRPAGPTPHFGRPPVLENHVDSRNFKRIAVAAACGALLALAPAASANCTPGAKPVFASWGDANYYSLLPNGGFESGKNGWTTSGGATVVAGNEPFSLSGRGASAMSLPLGASATSPMFCIEANTPLMRFVRRLAAGSSGTLRLDAILNGVPMSLGS